MLALSPDRAAGQLTCVAPPAGIRAWFTADGTAQDRIGVNQGALRNGATFAPGKVGQAFSFDGVDDAFEVADHPSLRALNVTVEAWVRLDTLASPGDGARELVISRQQSPGGLSRYELIKNVDDGFTFRIFLAGGLTLAATSTTPVVAGRFYHVASTYDGQAFRLYVDGELAASVSFVSPAD